MSLMGVKGIRGVRALNDSGSLKQRARDIGRWTLDFAFGATDLTRLRHPP